MTNLWNVIAPALPTLLGVVIGGLITYLTTRNLETQKWQQQKKDKLLQDRREALKLVMDWLLPIDLAVVRAIRWSVPNSIVIPGYDPDDWEKRWPDLATEISKAELPPASKFLLPSGIYEGVKPIIKLISEVHDLTVKATKEREDLKMNIQNQSDDVMAEHKRYFSELSVEMLEKLNELLDMAEQYRERLATEYRATYQ